MRIVLIAIAISLLAGCATYPETPEEMAKTYLAKSAKEAAAKNMRHALMYFNIAVDTTGQESSVRTMLDENPGLQQAFAAESITRISEVRTPDDLQAIASRASVMEATGIMTPSETSAIRDAVIAYSRNSNRSGTMPFLLSSKMRGLGLMESPEHMQIIVARSIKEENRAHHEGLAKAIFAYAADRDTPTSSKELIRASFDKLYVQQQDLSFAAAVFPAEAKRRGEFLAKAGQAAQPTYVVRRSVWDDLPSKQRELIARDYRMSVVEDSDYGLVTDVQTVDRSTPGSSAGSAIGSRAAQVAYIDHSFDSMNYSPWKQIGVGLLGAIVGSAANTAPVEQYQHFYTIRRGNGELFKKEELAGTPDRMAPGTCIDITDFVQAPQRICEETSGDLAKRLLGRLQGT